MKKIKLQRVQFNTEPSVSGRPPGFVIKQYDLSNPNDQKRIHELNLMPNGFVEVIYKLGETFKPDSCRERKPVYVAPGNLICVILAEGESFEAPQEQGQAIMETAVEAPKRTKKEKTQ